MFQLDPNVFDKQRSLSDYMRADESFALKKQAAQQDLAAGGMKMQGEKVKRAVQYLSMATPENWSGIRSQAIAEGLGDESIIPQQYDPNWINQTKAAFAGGGSDGGSTDYVVRQLMAEDPTMTYAGALQRLKGGLNQGILMGPDGGMNLAPGYTDARQAIKLSEAMGGKQADLTMNPQIRAAEYGVDLANKPAIEAATSAASAEGKAIGEYEGAQVKKAGQAGDTLDLITEAEKILPQSSSGMLESGWTAANAALGKSTDADKADRRLSVISAALTGNVPRFEGPQGVLDVELYKQAAADVANTNIPYESRLAALDTMKTLQKKYAQPNLNTTIPGKSPAAPANTPDPEAKQAKDGKWYKPDPNRPGKYLEVIP